jgi:uncharacterized protein YbbC (DUF1343 family)
MAALAFSACQSEPVNESRIEVQSQSVPATQTTGSLTDISAPANPNSIGKADGSATPVVFSTQLEQSTTRAQLIPRYNHVHVALLAKRHRKNRKKNRMNSEVPATHDKSSTGPLIKVESRKIGEGPTLTGLDVLQQKNFEPLHGKRVALLTNHSAINRDGEHILDLMYNNPNVNLVKLFSPEHGLYGNVDTKVADSRDTATGLMIHSLYSKRPASEAKPHHPRPSDLDDLDIVVVDMQDVGAVYYTYCSYMGYMMEECAKKGVEVMVLDRPNPIGGLYVDGPVIDADFAGSVTGYFRMPTAHGMTMGELAKMFQAEKNIPCKLTVVPCKNWSRDMYFDQTGLRWVDPSPNIQDLDAALVYPGIAITEHEISMGRGTPQPFHVFGAPWIEDPQEMIDEVTSGGLPGVKLEVADFTPTGTLARDHPGEQKVCHGARMTITDRAEFRPVDLGLRVITYLQKKYGKVYIPERKYDAKKKAWGETGFQVPQYDTVRIRGPLTAIVACRIQENKPYDETLKFIEGQVEQFKSIREKYLIYK